MTHPEVDDLQNLLRPYSTDPEFDPEDLEFELYYLKRIGEELSRTSRPLTRRQAHAEYDRYHRRGSTSEPTRKFYFTQGTVDDISKRQHPYYLTNLERTIAGPSKGRLAASMQVNLKPMLTKPLNGSSSDTAANDVQQGFCQPRHHQIQQQGFRGRTLSISANSTAWPSHRSIYHQFFPTSIHHPRRSRSATSDVSTSTTMIDDDALRVTKSEDFEGLDGKLTTSISMNINEEDDNGDDFDMHRSQAEYYQKSNDYEGTKERGGGGGDGTLEIDGRLKSGRGGAGGEEDGKNAASNSSNSNTNNNVTTDIIITTTSTTDLAGANESVVNDESDGGSCDESVTNSSFSSSEDSGGYNNRRLPTSRSDSNKLSGNNSSSAAQQKKNKKVLDSQSEAEKGEGEEENWVGVSSKQGKNEAFTDYIRSQHETLTQQSGLIQSLHRRPPPVKTTLTINSSPSALVLSTALFARIPLPSSASSACSKLSPANIVRKIREKASHRRRSKSPKHAVTVADADGSDYENVEIDGSTIMTKKSGGGQKKKSKKSSASNNGGPAVVVVVGDNSLKSNKTKGSAADSAAAKPVNVSDSPSLAKSERNIAQLSKARKDVQNNTAAVRSSEGPTIIDQQSLSEEILSKKKNGKIKRRKSNASSQGSAKSGVGGGKDGSISSVNQNQNNDDQRDTNSVNSVSLHDGKRTAVEHSTPHRSPSQTSSLSQYENDADETSDGRKTPKTSRKKQKESKMDASSPSTKKKLETIAKNPQNDEKRNGEFSPPLESLPDAKSKSKTGQNGTSSKTFEGTVDKSSDKKSSKRTEKQTNEHEKGQPVPSVSITGPSSPTDVSESTESICDEGDYGDEAGEQDHGDEYYDDEETFDPEEQSHIDDEHEEEDMDDDEHYEEGDEMMSNGSRTPRSQRSGTEHFVEENEEEEFLSETGEVSVGNGEEGAEDDEEGSLLSAEPSPRHDRLSTLDEASLEDIPEESGTDVDPIEDEDHQQLLLSVPGKEPLPSKPKQKNEEQPVNEEPELNGSVKQNMIQNSETEDGTSKMEPSIEASDADILCEAEKQRNSTDALEIPADQEEKQPGADEDEQQGESAKLNGSSAENATKQQLIEKPETVDATPKAADVSCLTEKPNGLSEHISEESKDTETPRESSKTKSSPEASDADDIPGVGDKKQNSTDASVISADKDKNDIEQIQQVRTTEKPDEEAKQNSYELKGEEIDEDDVNGNVLVPDSRGNVDSASDKVENTEKTSEPVKSEEKPKESVTCSTEKSKRSSETISEESKDTDTPRESSKTKSFMEASDADDIPGVGDKKQNSTDASMISADKDKNDTEQIQQVRTTEKPDEEAAQNSYELKGEETDEEDVNGNVLVPDSRGNVESASDKVENTEKTSEPVKSEEKPKESVTCSTEKSKRSSETLSEESKDTETPPKESPQSLSENSQIKLTQLGRQTDEEETAEFEKVEKQIEDEETGEADVSESPVVSENGTEKSSAIVDNSVLTDNEVIHSEPSPDNSKGDGQAQSGNEVRPKPLSATESEETGDSQPSSKQSTEIIQKPIDAHSETCSEEKEEENENRKIQSASTEAALLESNTINNEKESKNEKEPRTVEQPSEIIQRPATLSPGALKEENKKDSISIEILSSEEHEQGEEGVAATTPDSSTPPSDSDQEVFGKTDKEGAGAGKGPQSSEQHQQPRTTPAASGSRSHSPHGSVLTPVDEGSPGLEERESISGGAMSESSGLGGSIMGGQSRRCSEPLGGTAATSTSGGGIRPFLGHPFRPPNSAVRAASAMVTSKSADEDSFSEPGTSPQKRRGKFNTPFSALAGNRGGLSSDLDGGESNSNMTDSIMSLTSLPDESMLKRLLVVRS